MTFKEQLTITIVDKAAIGALLLIAGFWLNRFLERFKADRARENERERLRAQKHLEYLDRQLSEFYYPIYIRLHIDGATWERILDRHHGNDELRKRIGEEIEKNVILLNHEAIVAIIQSNIHLAEADQAAFDANSSMFATSRFIVLCVLRAATTAIQSLSTSHGPKSFCLSSSARLTRYKRNMIHLLSLRQERPNHANRANRWPGAMTNSPHAYELRPRKVASLGLVALRRKLRC